MLATKYATNKTSSIRIQASLKHRLDMIAKLKKSKLIVLLNQALTEYLSNQENLLKLNQFEKLQKQIEATENWTSQQEILAISKNRKKTTGRFSK